MMIFEFLLKQRGVGVCWRRVWPGAGSGASVEVAWARVVASARGSKLPADQDGQPCNSQAPPGQNRPTLKHTTTRPNLPPSSIEGSNTDSDTPIRHIQHLHQHQHQHLHPASRIPPPRDRRLLATVACLLACLLARLVSPLPILRPRPASTINRNAAARQ